MIGCSITVLVVLVCASSVVASQSNPTKCVLQKGSSSSSLPDGAAVSESQVVCTTSGTKSDQRTFPLSDKSDGSFTVQQNGSPLYQSALEPDVQNDPFDRDVRSPSGGSHQFMRFGRSHYNDDDDDTGIDATGSDTTGNDDDQFDRDVRTPNGGGGSHQFMRFGRNHNFLRFGRSHAAQNDVSGSDATGNDDEALQRVVKSLDHQFFRFGRGNVDGAGHQFMRFGRGNDVTGSDGNDDEAFQRVVKNLDHQFFRFGRGNAAGSGHNFMRFGRIPDHTFMRFGRSVRSGGANSDDVISG